MMPASIEGGSSKRLSLRGTVGCGDERIFEKVSDWHGKNPMQ